MKKRLPCSLLLILEMTVLFAGSAIGHNVKPSRVLLVISDQWKDPSSYLVADGGEFQTIVTLFKSWGIPFDILRLDQQVMDPNQFAGMHGKPRYGAILWDADTTGHILPQDFGVLAEAVEKMVSPSLRLGIGLMRTPCSNSWEFAIEASTRTAPMSEFLRKVPFCCGA
jgi:hypothetical protein